MGVVLVCNDAVQALHASKLVRSMRPVEVSRITLLRACVTSRPCLHQLEVSTAWTIAGSLYQPLIIAHARFQVLGTDARPCLRARAHPGAGQGGPRPQGMSRSSKLGMIV
eukprot:765047-Hanusia_phi.AAC.5